MARIEATSPALAGLSEAERREIFLDLKNTATEAADPQVQYEAVRDLAELFGPSAQAALAAVAENDMEPVPVRAAAARSIGATGDGALSILDRILDSSPPQRVKEGAVEGLAELGTRDALERVLSIAEGSPRLLRWTAVRVIERFDQEESVPTLTELAKGDLRRIDVRVAACRALAGSAGRPAADALVEAAADRENPRPVRIAALEALEKAEPRYAIDALEPLCEDASEVVAARSRAATARLKARLEATVSRAEGG
ncbi:MAG: HEAT repeat domain-containing protein [Planctomycetota bacterium]